MDNEHRQTTSREASGGVAKESASANRIAEDIRDRMSSLQPQTADRVQHAADAARQAAGGLHGKEEWMAQLIEQGASKLSDLADTLRSNDAETLLGKTQEFARRQFALIPRLAADEDRRVMRIGRILNNHRAGRRARMRQLQLVDR